MMLQEGQEETPAEDKPQEEEIDIDLNDPEVQNAAVKIQVNGISIITQVVRHAQTHTNGKFIFVFKMGNFNF